MSVSRGPGGSRAASKLIPNKQIRYIVSTHHHWDHLGGIRTYVHEGATIITHRRNRAFYEEILTDHRRILQPDRLSLHPPREVIEGYIFETLEEKYVVSDWTRTMDIYNVQHLKHSAGMLIVYLPKEKIVVEADLYNPPPPGAQAPATPSADSIAFYDNLQRLKLDVSLIAPIHGRVVPMADFLKEIGKNPAR